MPQFNIHWKGCPHRHLPHIRTASSQHTIPRSRSIAGRAAREVTILPFGLDLENARRKEVLRTRRRYKPSSRVSSSVVTVRNRKPTRAKQWDDQGSGQIRVGLIQTPANNISRSKDSAQRTLSRSDLDGAGCSVPSRRRFQQRNTKQNKAQKRSQAGGSCPHVTEIEIDPLKQNINWPGPIWNRTTYDPRLPIKTARLRKPSSQRSSRSSAWTWRASKGRDLLEARKKSTKTHSGDFQTGLPHKIPNTSMATPAFSIDDYYNRSPNQDKAFKRFSRDLEKHLVIQKALRDASLITPSTCTRSSQSCVSAQTIVEFMPYLADFQAAGLAVTSQEQKQRPSPRTPQSPYDQALPTVPKRPAKGKSPTYKPSGFEKAATDLPLSNYASPDTSPGTKSMRSTINTESDVISFTPINHFPGSSVSPNGKNRLPWLRKSGGHAAASPLNKDSATSSTPNTMTTLLDWDPHPAMLKTRLKNSAEANGTNMTDRPSGVKWTDLESRIEHSVGLWGNGERKPTDYISSAVQTELQIDPRATDGAFGGEILTTESLTNTTYGVKTGSCVRTDIFPIKTPSLDNEIRTLPTDFGNSIKLPSGNLRVTPKLPQRQGPPAVEDQPHFTNNRELEKGQNSESIPRPTPPTRRVPSLSKCQQCDGELPRYHSHSSSVPGTATRQYLPRFSLQCQQCKPTDHELSSTPERITVGKGDDKQPLEENGIIHILEDKLAQGKTAFQDLENPAKSQAAMTAKAKASSQRLQLNRESERYNQINSSVFGQALNEVVKDYHSPEERFNQAEAVADLVRESLGRCPMKRGCFLATDSKSLAHSVHQSDRNQRISSLSLAGSVVSMETSTEVDPGGNSDKDVFKGLQIAMAAACDPEIDSWIREISGCSVRRFLSNLCAFDGLGVKGLSYVAKKTARRTRSTDLKQASEMTVRRELQREHKSGEVERPRRKDRNLGLVAKDEAGVDEIAALSEEMLGMGEWMASEGVRDRAKGMGWRERSISIGL